MEWRKVDGIPGWFMEPGLGYQSVSYYGEYSDDASEFIVQCNQSAQDTLVIIKVEHWMDDGDVLDIAAAAVICHIRKMLQKKLRNVVARGSGLV